jgi:hypothetical protein
MSASASVCSSIRSMLCLPLVSLGCICAALPGHAGNVNFNFNTGEQGWQSLSGWEHTLDQANQKSWRVPAGTKALENVLLSPCLVVTDKTVQFIINEGHRFNFGDPKGGAFPPPGAGQVQFSTDPENPAAWRAIGLSAGGSWSNANNDVAPTLDPATIAAPAPLLLDGLAFEGVSPRYDKPNNNGVSSLAVLPPLAVGSHLQFRFMAAVRDPAACPDPTRPGPIWDVNKLLIKGVALSPFPCPEPAHTAEGALAAGLGLELVRRVRRLRRRPAAAGRAPAGSAPAPA